MESKHWRFLIPQKDFDAVDVSHWSPYQGPPAKLTQLNGYVMFTCKALVQDKSDLFTSIKNCVRYDDLASLLEWKAENPGVFNQDE